jgi:triphosphatase
MDHWAVRDQRQLLQDRDDAGRARSMTDESSAEPASVFAPPVEIELKFELASGQIRRLASHPAFAQPPSVKRMASTYFDTPSFALRAAGLSLRVRRVGGRYVQTVKRSRGGLFDRDEWEAFVPALRVDPETLDGTPAAKTVARTGEPLVPVAVIRTHRSVRHWASAAGSVEIAVDRCEVLAGHARERFSELELELKSGSPKVVHELADALFGLSPLRLALTSKGDRGYRLAGAAALGFEAGLEPSMDVAQAFAAIGRACLAQVIEHAAAFRENPQPDAIHQTRVGLRRLRTAFRLFESIVVDGQRARLDVEAQWLAGELGPARSLDVFLEDVFDPSALSDARVAEAYGERLRKARRLAYRKAMEALSSERFARLTLDLALWIEDGAWRRPNDAGRAAWLSGPIGVLASSVLEDQRRAVRKRGRSLATLDPESRHKLRIRAKRLRYASEFFAGAFSGGQKKRAAFVAALKDLQTALGLLNDMAEAQASATSILGPRAPQAMVFAAGELVGRLRARQGKNLDRSESRYKALMKAKRFWAAPEPINPA